MPALIRWSVALALVLAAAAACKTERYVHVPVFAPPGDAGELPPGMRPDDGNVPIPPGDDDDDDDGPDAAADAGLTPTKKTQGEAKLRNVARPIERAQFGFEGDAGLFIEAYQGGEPMCPTTSQPQPDRTLIVTGVKKTATPGTKLTSADGVKATLFDFRGDQLPDAPFRATATAVKITVVAVTASAAVDTVELDVDATFAEGTVKARLYAGHCASLD